MPIYEFICKRCGEKFELLVPRQERKCPKCGSEDLERRFSKLSWVDGPYFLSLKEDGLRRQGGTKTIDNKDNGKRGENYHQGQA